MFKFLSLSLKCSQDVLVRFTFAGDGTSGMCAVFSNWPIRVRSSPLLRNTAGPIIILRLHMSIYILVTCGMLSLGNTHLFMNCLVVSKISLIL